MNHLDLGGFLFVTGLSGGLSLAFLLAIVRTYYPKSIAGISEWIAASLMFALIAMSLAGALPLPPAVTMLVGHVLAVSAAALVFASLRRFARLRTDHRRLLACLAAVYAVLACFTFVSDNYMVRVVVAMAAQMMLVQASFRTVLTLPDKGGPEALTLAALGAMFVLFGWRIWTVATGADAAPPFISASGAQRVYYVVLCAAAILLVFGFITVVSKRLRDTLIFAAVYEDLGAQERQERWELGAALQDAAERGELSVLYQPRVDTRSNRIVAAEALLRWEHPTRGQIPPDKFIGIAEETGAIATIGAWVLREGVACAAHLARTQPGMIVSINISAHQLTAPGFVAQVRDAIAAAGAEPSSIELELTESAVIDDPDAAQAAMEALRALGVHLSIDDFGTGYSSLSYLRRLPVSCVKIDRSFIKDIIDSEDAQRLTQAIIGIGHALHLNIVAEGVETEEQRDILRLAGVHEYQGYLFSRPVPEAQLAAMLVRQSPAPRAMSAMFRAGATDLRGRARFL